MTTTTTTATNRPIYARPMPKAEDFKPLVKVANPALNRRRGTPPKRKRRTIL